MADTDFNNLIETNFSTNKEDMKNFKKTIDKHQQLCSSLENDNCKKHGDIVNNDMNVLEKREKIWGHLNQLYINNSDEQNRLYKKIKYNKEKMEEQKKELLFLKEKYRNSKMGNSTHERNIDLNKYERSKHIYYINLYITILLVNIVLIFVMFLINYNIITPTIFYIITFVVYFVLILYIINYVYFNNYDRDYFYWDKFLFGTPDDDTDTCPTSLTSDELASKKFNDTANDRIKNFVNNNSNTQNNNPNNTNNPNNSNIPNNNTNGNSN